MATERQLSKVIQNGQEYRIIGTNVHDATITLKNHNGTETIGSFSTNQQNNDSINLPIPPVDSALSDSSENPVQNKKVKEALDTKITNPSGGTAGQVLKKTANSVEWANESGGGGDEIVYLSQDQYDALTQEEKMNGTHYGIVGNASSLEEAALESFIRYINRAPLDGGTIPAGTSTALDVTIPEGANLFVLITPYVSGNLTCHSVFSINEIKAVFNAGAAMFGAYGAGQGNPRITAVSGNTFTLGSNTSSYSSSYYFF